MASKFFVIEQDELTKYGGGPRAFTNFAFATLQRRNKVILGALVQGDEADFIKALPGAKPLSQASGFKQTDADKLLSEWTQQQEQARVARAAA